MSGARRTKSTRRLVIGASIAVGCVACAAGSPPHPPHGGAEPTSRDAGPDGPSRPDAPSLEALAARGATDAPMMREALRLPEAAATPTTLEAKGADTCYRAVVGANVPATAWFEDDKRSRRGEVSSGAGLVPPRGPACARKGETLRLVVEVEAGGVARAIVWQSP